MRNLILAMLFLGACEPPDSDQFRTKTPQASVIVSSSPANHERMFSALRGFAAQEGFHYRERTIPTAGGDDRMFEMRRRDVWVLGHNVMMDNEVDLPSDETGIPDVNLTIDDSTWEIFFYPGERPASFEDIGRLRDRLLAAIDPYARSAD